MKRFQITLVMYCIALLSFSQTFNDLPANEPNGAAPQNWDILEGAAKIDTFDGTPVIDLDNNSIITPKLNSEDYLTNNFSIKFKAYFNEVLKSVNYQNYELRLWPGNSNVVVPSSSGEGYYGPIAVRRHGVKMNERIGSSNVIKHESSEQSLKDKVGVWRDISLIYNNGSLKVLIDNFEALNINQFNYVPTMISIGTKNNEYSADFERNIKNIIIEGISGINDESDSTEDEPEPQSSDIGNSFSGLEALDEGNGIGWRLVGRNPDNYSALGLGAVDLSYSNAESEVRGASGEYSIAIGYRTQASNNMATAMGLESIASGFASTSIGEKSKAIGSASVAMGNSAEAAGDFSTAIGISSIASGKMATAIGNGAIANGESSVSIGYNTNAVDNYALALGYETVAAKPYATAFGYKTEANLNMATAFGNKTKANGFASTAMGEESVASGSTSLATGYGNSAIGNYSTVMGMKSKVTGSSSFALGESLIASKDNSFVIGRFNEIDNASSVGQESVFVVGNGTSKDVKNNAFIIQKNGNARLSGKLAQSSDYRLKKNIENLNYGLKDILNLRPVTYNWKSDSEVTTKSFGLIAQEVQPIISEIVGKDTNEKGTLHVSYIELIPVLINSIKQQQEIIKGLIETNNSQNAEINEVRAELTKKDNAIKMLDSKIYVIEELLKRLNQ